MKFILPEGVLKQHIAVLGKTGSGKSSVLRYFVEHLLASGKRVCVLDPKGDWYGLKSGFPIIGFGDFKEAKAQDVPINAQSGKHVAELITSGNRPCIIGFRGWMTSHMIRFWIDFASTIFNANSGELYIVGDEFHNFAPKGKILNPEAGNCLHWSNRLMSEGRGLGLICLIASQRPQKVHNDTLTCCETLVAMRVIHAADRGAIKDWIDGCGDKAQGQVVLDSVAGMARGEAFVWSPEINYGPERITFPMFKTFDSFAPPQMQKKISAAGWADVDLEEVKTKMETVIAEAKANDPGELKKRVRELEKELAAKKPASEIREVPVFSAAELKRLAKMEDTTEAAKRSADALVVRMEKIYIELGLFKNKKIGAQPAAPRASSPIKINRIDKDTPSKPVLYKGDGPNANGELDPGKQKILDTIKMLNVRGITPNRNNIARWHLRANRKGIHPTGGTYGQDLAFLRAQGYLNGCELTEKGNTAANDIETGLEAAKRTVDAQQQRILEQLENGETHDRNSLAAALDLHPTGGTYGQNLARLRVMELIPERGTIMLSDAALK